MSGGSYDYAYRQVEEFIERLDVGGSTMTNDLRSRFRRHLVLVAAAMKAIEWVDSADNSSPHDDDAIRAALAPAPSAICGLCAEPVLAVTYVCDKHAKKAARR